jgi:hypothetical protein
VAAAPRWVGLLAGLTIAAAAANAGFMSTVVGRHALVDQWERTALAFGQAVDDTRYADFQALSAQGPLYGALSALLNVPAAIVAAAVVIYAVFRRSGNVRFAAVLAMSVHAGTIMALRVIAGAPIAYARETTASATSLGVWFPGLDETSAAARMLGLVDLFAVWWAVVLAIGVSVLYQRGAGRTAAGFVGVYLVVALGLAAVMAVLGGTA